MGVQKRIPPAVQKAGGYVVLKIDGRFERSVIDLNLNTAVLVAACSGIVAFQRLRFTETDRLKTACAHRTCILKGLNDTGRTSCRKIPVIPEV
jgi:5-enolpyruvylshikimate-3-phosphate synthase